MAAIGGQEFCTKAPATSVPCRTSLQREAEGDTTVFTIKVVQSFSKPLPRQVTEAVMIDKARSDTSIISLNSRAEFRQPAIPRVIVTRERQEDNREQEREEKTTWRSQL